MGEFELITGVSILLGRSYWVLLPQPTSPGVSARSKTTAPNGKIDFGNPAFDIGEPPLLLIDGHLNGCPIRRQI